MSSFPSEYYLIPHIVRPRCLLCSKTMYLRDKLFRKKETIVCPRCGVRYARTFIVDADPDMWERVRLRRMFSVNEEASPPQLFLDSGMGSRRRAK